MMWGGDVQNDYSNTNWALNPSAYQNLPNEQVDWATLAQQWIKMKETLPVDQVPAAPPPPSIKADIEAGEAPMDMSKDDSSPGRNTAEAGGGNWNNWSSWQQWNSWGWGGTADSAGSGEKGSGVPPYTYSASTGNSAYAADASMPAAATFDYNHGAAVPDNYNQQNYWSAGGPGPYMRNRPSDWRGGRQSSGRSRHSTKAEEVEVDTSPVLDAAKRKQLPAWIREGLEKMEREKQRKMERDRQIMEREQQLQRQKEEEEAAIASGIPVKSKFETDSEESETEREQEESSVKPRRSRFDSTVPNPATVTPKPVPKSYSPPPVQHKTKEEIMQDVVQQMRYVLTDILMKVTNEEMHRIAEEVLTEMRAKAPATQLRKTPALTSLTGKLGLGIYDSDSNEESDQSEDESSKPTNGVDSDEELRERIMRKKQEFSRIERDIEQMVELQEEKERERERVREQTDSESESETTKPPQVEPNPALTGVRTGIKVEEPRVHEIKIEPISYEREIQTPDKPHKSEHMPSETQTEDSDNSTSSKSESSSRSSSSSRRRKSKKSKKKKDKKSSKRKRKRSTSRSSDRRKSHRKSGRYEERDKRSRSRSRSRERDHYRRHSSESSRSHKRKHRSYSRDYSPDYHYRGKKSSHRSWD